MFGTGQRRPPAAMMDAPTKPKQEAFVFGTGPHGAKNPAARKDAPPMPDWGVCVKGTGKKSTTTGETRPEET